MNQHETPLLVEVFLKGARIKGLCSATSRRTRLSEVLNSPNEALKLDSSVVTMDAGPQMQSPALTIEKKTIVAAIPWETKEQNRQRELTTSISGRAQTTATDLVVFSPPFVISGTAHIAGGFSTGRYELRPDPSVFAHFFSVTEARLTLPDGSLLEAPVILVNREVVSAMAKSIEIARLRLVA